MNLKELKHLDKDKILESLGLKTKSSMVGRLTGALGTFGVGLLVGVGLGLMLAPKNGRELRGDIRNRLCHASNDVGEPVQEPHRA